MAIGNGAAQAESRSKHPTSFPSGGEPVEGPGADVGGGSITADGRSRRTGRTAPTRAERRRTSSARHAMPDGAARPGRGPGDRRPGGGRDGRDRAARPAPPPPARRRTRRDRPLHRVRGRRGLRQVHPGRVAWPRAWTRCSPASRAAPTLGCAHPASCCWRAGDAPVTSVGRPGRGPADGGGPGPARRRARSSRRCAAGRDVVCDRYIGSSVAYQGHGRGLDAGRRPRDLGLGGRRAVARPGGAAGRAGRGGRGVAPAAPATASRPQVPSSTAGWPTGSPARPRPSPQPVGPSSTAPGRSTRCDDRVLDAVRTGSGWDHDGEPRRRLGRAEPLDLWSEVVGQDDAVARLRAAAAHAGARLPAGRARGLRASARRHGPSPPTCSPPASTTRRRRTRGRRLVAAEAHPALTVVERDGASITAEQAREVVRRVGLAPGRG